MTRVEWLKKEHRRIDEHIEELEKERETIRSAEHKALLSDLKKQRLRLKTELLELA